MRTGTSSVVVAAFVGPGTVLTCASAGVSFGYQLGWVLVFATVTAFVLQSFTASTGILARQGLGEAVRASITGPVARPVAFGLIVLGLWIGCASFELGNLVGAASGLAALAGVDIDPRWLVAALTACAAVILLFDVRVLIRVFTGLVISMSLLFLAGWVVTPFDTGAALSGLFVPRVPEGGLLTVVALIGTTVVTYNLFLHAAVAKRYWADTDDRAGAWRTEVRGMGLFLPVGGLVSYAILSAGAALYQSGAELDGVASFAVLIEPVAGSASRVLFGLGLFAAGLTSALTAPLAAAAGICEVFGWDDDAGSTRYRAVWGSVLAAGLCFSLTGLSPLPAIVAAQAANGILLPLIAVFVLYLSIRQTTVTLPIWYRGLGIAVTTVCAGLGLRTLWWAWTQMRGLL